MAKLIDDPLDRYVVDLFAQEDELLAWIQAETSRQQMPEISVRPDEGRLLQMLVRAVGARQVVEIGVLAGYSGVWIARALPADGKLYALEVNAKHARVARASFARAGLDGRVEVLEGPALESLKRLEDKGPFDFVFIDADKMSYASYLAWAVEHLRPGGMVAAHNAFRGGQIAAPKSEEDHAMDAFNRALAADSRLESTIIAVGDGMAVGIRK